MLSERGLQHRGIDALNDQPQARITSMRLAHVSNPLKGGNLDALDDEVLDELLDIAGYLLQSSMALDD